MCIGLCKTPWDGHSQSGIKNGALDILDIAARELLHGAPCFLFACVCTTTTMNRSQESSSDNSPEAIDSDSSSDDKRRDRSRHPNLFQQPPTFSQLCALLQRNDPLVTEISADHSFPEGYSRKQCRAKDLSWASQIYQRGCCTRLGTGNASPVAVSWYESAFKESQFKVDCAITMLKM
jgi:hypothetical protein